MLTLDIKFKAFLIDGNHFIATLKHRDSIPFIELQGDCGVSFPLKGDETETLIPGLIDGSKFYFNKKLEFVGVEGSEAVTAFLTAPAKGDKVPVRKNGNRSCCYENKSNNF